MRLESLESRNLLAADFGDAPLPYPTTLAENGARHEAIGPTLGFARTEEADGVHSGNATSDAGDDGVTFGVLRPFSAATLTVNVQNAVGGVALSGWIDFNSDGDWSDSGELVVANFVVVNGIQSFGLYVPESAVSGTTFARFRLSTSSNPTTPTGFAADGEVEDYQVTVLPYVADFGDAPIPYPTTLAENGARHESIGPRLGALRDAELDGAHSATASLHTDDDGVTFASLRAGREAAVTVDVRDAPAGARLDAWIDFNADGDWDDSGERILSNRAVVSGTQQVLISVPATSIVGTSFARFRLSTTDTLAPVGRVSDGEVEDYAVSLLAFGVADFGDAPPPYQTTLAENGAWHEAVGPTLGLTRSEEADGAPSTNANDDAGDDGVIFGTLRAGTSATLTVSVQNAAVGAKLDGWIDFNADGDWSDAGEHVVANRDVVSGSQPIVLNVAASAVVGKTFARFRLSTTGSSSATGHAENGEVEDYAIQILSAPPPATPNPLIITEINYHPSVPYSGAFDKDEYEFVELFNAGGTPIQLAGVNFQARTGVTTNITVTIGNRILQPGDYGLLVRNPAAMQERYGADVLSKIVANWPAASTLANAGNTIRLLTPVGINQNTIVQFSYNDGSDDGELFPNRPDGYGATLELVVDPNVVVNQAYYQNLINWKASEEYLGSPGRAGKLGLNQRVVINEILANSNDAINEIDKLELVNVSDDPVDLGGWMITDNDDNPVGVADFLQAYVIPIGTILRPGEYLTLDESQFNPPGANNSIALSSLGETLYLISREPDGTRRFEDVVEFGATRTSQSIGRTPNLTGSFLPMTTQTFGTANSAHELSPLVITEIMYKRWTPNPDLNFIELYNRTNAAINVGANTGWNVNGVGFTFPNGSSIAANTAVVLVGFNLADTTKLNAFRNAYSISATVPIFSWWKQVDPGNLSDNGEPLGLYQPFVDGPIPVPKVLVDYVDYNDTSPWPEGPAGGIAGASYSLTRVSPDSIGDLPHSWRGALPSPGAITFPAAASPLDGLVISEFAYNPLPAGFDHEDNPLSNNGLEFVELYNSAGSTLNVAHAGIGDGVEFRFLPGTTVASGERIVVVPFNPAIASAPRDEFFGRYGLSLEEVRLFGPWSRSLSKNGEHLALVDALGNTFFEVTYSDDSGWPRRADGRGSSLELIDPDRVPASVEAAELYLNNPAHWRASREIWGSPGTAGSGPLAASVVINEVLAHTDAPFTDAIELLNVSNAPVELIDWALTDDMTKDPATSLFVLPHITLNPGESITFDAGPSGFGGLFKLSGIDGEQVYLVGYDEQAQRFVFVDEVEFPAAFNGVSLGRWPNGSGAMFPMQSRTLSQFDTTPTPGNVYTNGANSGPAISDIVISEIMYNPGGASAADFEFIELLNRTNVALSLGPIEDGSGWADSQPQGWRIKGAVDFEFGTEHVIPAAGTLIAVSFDPVQTPAKLAAFREHYGVAANVPIVGPFERWRWIPDDGGEIRLDRPDSAPADLPLSERFTPNVLVDRVTYDDAAPWPTAADGHGQSLSRVSDTRFGDLADSWYATDPTPGSYSPGGPRVTSVVLSGSAWTDEFVSAVSAGNLKAPGYAIPTGSQQLTPIPWTNIDQISIAFDRDVTVLPNALSVVGAGAQMYSVAAMPVYDPAAFTATWQLSQPIGNDQLLLNLRDAKVLADGVALDGEWANAWPATVSGNGLPGGAFLFSFVVGPGDVNQDGTVGDSDLRGVLTAAFATVGTDKYQPTHDLDGSGHINHVDAIFARNQRHQPAPLSALAARLRREDPTIGRIAAVPRRQLRAVEVDRAIEVALSQSTAEPSVGNLSTRHQGRNHGGVAIPLTRLR